MERKVFNCLIIAAMMCIMACSCGNSKKRGLITEIYSGKRDKIESRELKSIDDKLPALHSQVRMFMIGDTLIINDGQSRDHQFYAYDVVGDRYLGKFGKYGAGPDEIANFGTIGVDQESGILYGVDYSKWKVLGFNIAEALSDSTYHPLNKVDFDKGGDTRMINRPLYINDSTVFCAIATPSSDFRRLNYYLGRFSLLDGKCERLDSINPYSGLLCLNPAKEELIEFSLEFDRINLYDFQGNLKRTIYGPDYKDYNRRIEYFNSPVVVGDRIYAIYINGDFKDSEAGHQIVVMDFEGNYLNTIDVGVRVDALAYNPTTRRLFVSTWDEPQFGYFEVEDLQ